MIRDDTRNKARAVLLTAIMVISIFGGSVAFAGSAAAAVSSSTLETTAIQDGGEIRVTGSVDADYQDSTNVFLVISDDNTFDSSSDTSADTGDAASDGTFDVTASDGDAGIDLSGGDEVTIYAHEGSPEDGETLDSQAGSLTVDDSSPTGENPTPADDAVVSDNTPTITLDLTESETSINESSIEVRIQQTDTDPNEELFYRLDATEAQGISFADGTLTIDVEQAKLSQLPDGTIDVTVNAEDEAGNTLSGTNNWDFEVDTNPLSVSFNDGDPADTPDDSAVLTSDSTSVSADVSSTSADISEASVTISGPSYEETVTTGDNQYTSGTFDIDIGSTGDEDLPALPDGNFTVTVSATDADGFNALTSRTFEVDTSGPSVDSITINNGDIVNTDNADSVPVVIDFNETVRTNTVDANLNIDGSTQVGLGNAGEVNPENTGENREVVTFTVDLRDDSSSDVGTSAFDSGTAQIVVNSATDDHETSASSIGASESFSIDTEAPSVSEAGASDALPTADGDVVLSGVVDFAEAFTASGGEGNSAQYYIKPGESGDYVELTNFDSPLADYNTSQLPEGTHTLKVNITDDADNTVKTTRTVNIDNEEPAYVYTGSGSLTGTVDLAGEDFDLQNNGTETGTFYHKSFEDQAAAESGVNSLDNDMSNDDGYTQSSTLDVNSVGGGPYVIAVEVNDPGYDGASPNTEVVTTIVDAQSLKEGDVSLSVSENANDASQVNVTLTSQVKLTGFNVTTQTTDNYYQQSSGVLSESAFTMNETSTESGGYEYTYVSDPIRDGTYTFAIDNATLDQQMIETGFADDDDQDYTVDAGAPEMVDADLTGAQAGQMSVQLTFDEPVQNPSGFENFQGATVSLAELSPEDGIVNVTVDDEVQTGDMSELVANGVTEGYPTNDRTTTTTTGADVTFELGYESGISVVSIPAETGSVDLDDIEFADDVDSVMTYDPGGETNWAVYDAETGDGDLQRITGGEGYIVKAGSGDAVELNVQNVPSDAEAQAINNVDLDNGFNLVGAYQEGDQSVEQALAPLPNSADYSIQRGYTGTFVDTLESGEGYWLFVNDETAYHVPVDYTGLQSSQPEVYNVNVDVSTTDGNDAFSVSAQVDADNPVDKVVVDAPAIGVNGVELTYDEGAGEYNKDITTNYPSDIETTQSVDVTVTAFDIYGNLGQAGAATDATENVAPSLDSASQSTASDITTVTLDISDSGSGLLASSITESSFELTSDSQTPTVAAEGFSTGVTDGDGTGTVTFTLDGDYSTEDITVAIASGESIDDVAGNQNTAGTATATAPA